MSLAELLTYQLLEMHSYASVQCDLPEEMATQIKAIMKNIPKEHLAPGEATNIRPHTTVFYGLSDQDLPVVQEGLQNFGDLGFTVRGKPELFESDQYKVLHLPVDSQCFQTLHKHIGNITGKEPPTFKDYKPHVTLAYLKKDSPMNIDIPFSSLNGTTPRVQFYTTSGTKPTQISLV